MLGLPLTQSENRLVRYERHDPGVGVITIDRPERLNALNMAVKRQLEAHLRTAEADALVMVIIITGAGKSFVAGSDIAEMRDMGSAQHQALGTNDVFVMLRSCTKPVIAAVEGYALGGGCELALGCDMIVAGEGARFGQPEIRVGIMPGAGGTQLLMRAVGRYRAMKLCLTGDQISATEAAAMGLVSDLAPDGEALAEAMTLASRICAMPSLAVRSIKSAFRQGQEQSLESALAAERRLFEGLFDTFDQAEGMAAFLEKRAPRYTGS